MKKSLILTNIYVLFLSILICELFILVFKLPSTDISDSTAIKILLEHARRIVFVFTLIIAPFLFYWLGTKLLKIIRSQRVDVIISFTLGIGIALYFNWNEYQRLQELIQKIISEPFLLWLIIFLESLYFIFLAIFYPEYLKNKVSEERKSDAPKVGFYKDDPWKPGDEDLLGYKILAETFAKKVVENKSEKSSLVFGIEAPWGTGKTSFLNMCEEEWKKEKKETIVLRFDPWHFSSDVDLINKFFEQLKLAINDKYYLPEINKYIRDYLRIINSISFTTISLHFSQSVDSLDKTHKEIEEYLGLFGKQIIVIIDDLDRVPLDKAKQILKLVALCANFPYITYVLCYDLENLYSTDVYTTKSKTKGSLDLPSISQSYTQAYSVKINEDIPNENVFLKETQEIDSSPLQNYLEKIVNIKYILPYFRRDKLLDYLAKSLYDTFFQSDDSSSLVRPLSESEFYQNIEEFFFSKPFITRKFVFSLRHVKSIINTFKSIKEGDRRFFIYDLEKVDQLILLLILKYHYPKIYADICYYEFGRKNNYGRYSFDLPKYHFTPFSTIWDEKHPKPGYTQYVIDNALDETVTSILGMLFNNASSSLDNYHLNQYIKFIEGIEETNLTDAVFIGFFRKIDSLDQITLLDSFSEYLNDSFPCLQSKSLKTIVEKNRLVHAFYRKTLSRVYEINRINDQISLKLLYEAIDALPNYSYYSSDNVEDSKNILIFVLQKLLNDGVWNKKGAGQNSIDNIRIISHYILGDEKKNIQSILEKIGENGGAIAIYDILTLRLYCNQSRSRDLWEISRSLMWHKLSQNGKVIISDQQVNQTTDDIAMEEITIKAFSIFKGLYIDTTKNIFRDIEDLKSTDFLGKEVAENKEWLELIEREEKFENGIEAMRTGIEVFTIYDLCLDGDHNGMRCGGYDFEGEKIRNIMQDYLFDTCFKVEDNKLEGFDFFVHFLIRNFKRNPGSEGDRYSFNFGDITKVFDKDRLLRYWAKYGGEIKKYFSDKEGRIITPNYIAYYNKTSSVLTNEDKTGVFDRLDQQLEKEKVKYVT